MVSSESQIFVVDTQRNDINTLKNIIYSENSNENKTILSLSQKNKFGVNRDINYPLTIIARDSTDNEIFAQVLEYNDLNRFATLKNITQAGNISFEIIDNNGQKIETQLFFAPEEAHDIVTKI
jgi:hypothetical protein